MRRTGGQSEGVRSFTGGVTRLNDCLRGVRPAVFAPFEVRFETPAARPAQVDFAHFIGEFTEQPGVQRRVWLFAIVLGHSRYLWDQYVLRQDLGTVLRCHMLAFEHFGGTPQEILYDRMKTAVLGEAGDAAGIVYNAKLIALGAHYGFKLRVIPAGGQEPPETGPASPKSISIRRNPPTRKSQIERPLELHPTRQLP